MKRKWQYFYHKPKPGDNTFVTDEKKKVIFLPWTKGKRRYFHYGQKEKNDIFVMDEKKMTLVLS
jgi:hypothetical protein